MNNPSIEGLHFDERGLIPAVVQDAETGTVLMLAYMNRESLKLTIETGETHFWSRSRNKIWHKGETSGNVQTVLTLRYDCDADSLLVTVNQHGSACHTGEFSCFFTQFHASGAATPVLGEVLGRLSGVIHKRKTELPEGSYTAKLFKEGVDRILKKVGEESGEVIIAAKNHNKQEITWEVSDLLYHTMVLLEQEGVGLGEIAGELERRSKKM
jgi:phosphoribosyl-AMP cyclohydrolase / phosphoribosyl-ATP pyrophosphohydrolase